MFLCEEKLWFYVRKCYFKNDIGPTGGTVATGQSMETAE